MRQARKNKESIVLTLIHTTHRHVSAASVHHREGEMVVCSRVLQGESVGVFREGIELVLNDWRPFRIVIENELAGCKTRFKANQLVTFVHSRFIKSTEPLDVVDLQNILEVEFLCSFYMLVEDGTVKEVAEKLMDMYDECLQGNFRSVEILREAQQARPPATLGEMEGCLLQGESVGVLREGIGYVLNGWRPLKIAVENKWGGHHSSIKAYQLATDVHSWFIRSTEQPDVVDLQTLLEDELVCSFYIPVEDGKVKEVAEKIMAVYKECLQGDFGTVEILREASKAQPAHPPTTQSDTS